MPVSPFLCTFLFCSASWCSSPVSMFLFSPPFGGRSSSTALWTLLSAPSWTSAFPSLVLPPALTASALGIWGHVLPPHLDCELPEDRNSAPLLYALQSFVCLHKLSNLHLFNEWVLRESGWGRETRFYVGTYEVYNGSWHWWLCLEGTRDQGSHFDLDTY